MSDRLTDLGPSALGVPFHSGNRRRQFRSVESTTQDVPRLPPPRRLALTMRAPSPTVGSFAFTVRDLPDSISIMGNKYMKAPILQRLNLTEEDICLAAYLSDKGAAACPHANLQGHDRADSIAHVFSDAVLALRPTFEPHPFKAQRAAAASSQSRRASGGRGRGRPSASSSAPVPRLQYRPEQAAPAAAPQAAAAASAVAAATTAG